MTSWTDELARIDGATELQVASRRRDGSPRAYVTIWLVRAGDDIYVRSAYGYDKRLVPARSALGRGQDPRRWCRA
jgi:hypothetical protein